MDIILYSDGSSPVHRLDPRAKILAAALLTVVLSQCEDMWVLLAALGIAVAGLFVARVPFAAVLQRLVPLNALLILLAALLMFTTPGDRLFQIAQADASYQGLSRGVTILLKANAIVTFLAILAGTIEFVALGKALGQLGVPHKLVNLLLFTVRYINLMLVEFERLSQAAVLRGFRPGLNRHTLQTTGYLIGMVLVRSYERGGRMLDAMKLRGYDGALTWAQSATWQRRDSAFLAGAGLLAASLVGGEWL